MLAADVAVQAVLKGDFSSGYLREYDRLLHQKYMSGRLLARIFFKLLHRPMAGRFMLRFLSFLASKPHSNQLLLDLLYSNSRGKLIRSFGFLFGTLLRLVSRRTSWSTGLNPA
jgi:hypothetical protein